MKATARRRGGFTHRIAIRDHELTVDEPTDHGGSDQGPSPQELLAASIASCTAITLEMYADRKGWDIGELEVECEYETPQRGSPATFKMVLRLPASCTQEQLDMVRIVAAKCPVHRLLEGESVFEERIELVTAERA
ncbi:MAG: OsmC family protein [Acidimicrobiales bacterium]|jgi:putative redox protein